MPCDSGGGVCIVTGHGNDLEGDWLCSQVVAQMEDSDGGICEKKRMNKTINDDVNFPGTDILFTSYNFKYNFLEGCKKGNNYITWYYKISEISSKKPLDYNSAVEKYNIIKNDILPLCRELMNNPKSNLILITPERYSNFIQKLNVLDTDLNDPEATQIINQVKNDLTLYKNKSISYVYDNFKS